VISFVYVRPYHTLSGESDSGRFPAVAVVVFAVEFRHVGRYPLDHVTIPANNAQFSGTLGGDGPALVLLHAGIADSRMWSSQIHSFAGHFTVLCYDMRGFGGSTAPDEPFSHHADLRAILNEMDIKRAHLVGVSMGASVALDFALAYPDVVDRLVLCAVLGPPPRSQSLLDGWAAAEVAYERDGLPAVNEVEMRIWVDGPLRSASRVDPAIRALVAEMNLPILVHEESAEHESDPLEPPAHQRLGEVVAPTLVITGDVDQPDVIDYCGHLAKEITNARLEIINNVAHMLNMEAPSRFNELVVNFLTE
jgi:3-oxoadipate enol-lactonase